VDTVVPGQTLNVTVIGDALDESEESITFTLSNPINAILGPQSQSTLTIVDNDDPPSVYFSAELFATIESSGGMTINVTLNTASGQVVPVDYATSDITATAGTDYTSASGTLTYQPGETSRTFWIAVDNDTLTEPNETVQLTLSNPTNGTFGLLDTATFQINDNDQPTILIANDDWFTLHHDGMLGIPSQGLLANDTVSMNPVTEVVVEIPPEFGTLDLHSDGSFLYTPDLFCLSRNWSLPF
jgi:hypothetical protein